MKASDPEPEPAKSFTPRSTTVRVTTPGGFTVTEEDYDEHHMSSYELHFIISEPIESVSRFRTTNGKCFYDEVSDRLVIKDRALTVEIDPQTLQCRHQHADSSHWYVGLGRASSGQFPSAYEPRIKRPPYRKADRFKDSHSLG